jgi:hypothetical protein
MKFGGLLIGKPEDLRSRPLSNRNSASILASKAQADYLKHAHENDFADKGKSWSQRQMLPLSQMECADRPGRSLVILAKRTMLSRFKISTS